MRIVPRLTFIILFSVLTPPVHAFVVGQSCGQLFGQTDDVIAYIADLSQNQKISSEQMSRLYEALKNEDKFTNPYTEQDAIAADVFIHWQKFEELVRDSAVDKKKLAKWLEEKVKEKVRVKGEREQTKQETQDSHVKIKFNHIKRGSFMIGEPGKQVLTTIDYDFEMMAHKFTQMQWALLTGENPAHYVDGPHTIEIDINGKKIKVQPNNPVERVSFEDIQNKCLIRLNELSDKDDPLIYQIIPDHVKGAKYRLPTVAEWEFVGRNQGTNKKQYPFDTKIIGDHAWYYSNSNEITHPVGEKLPQIVNGHEFEMYGNVWEWVSEAVTQSSSESTQTNESYTQTILGGSMEYDITYLRFSVRRSVPYNMSDSDIGFRLVRIKNNP